MSLINAATYHKIANSSEPLKPAQIKLKTYTGECIALLGTTTVRVKCGEAKEELLIYVADGEGPNLMGRD